ncbi:MAG: hypothetical protein AB4426_32020 [Xenococcaceae cyanobacterium]
MGEIDELLAQLKAEYKQKEQLQQQSRITPPPQAHTNFQHQVSSPMEKQNQASPPLDNLLVQVKAEFEEKKKPAKSTVTPPAQNQASSLTDDLLGEVKAEFEEKKTQHRQQPQKSSSARRPSGSQPTQKLENNLLQELQAEYQEKERAEEERRQQQLVKETQRQEQRQQRQRQALVRKAQEWLKNLDPNSDEGLWFEEFSYSYDSKLEAAIDYMEALRETRFNG